MIQNAWPSMETAVNTKRTATAERTKPANPRFKNENRFCRKKVAKVKFEGRTLKL